MGCYFNTFIVYKKLILVLNHGALELFEVQLEGANKISGKEFIKRYSLDNGDT
mgnify:CR=1 FL=1